MPRVTRRSLFGSATSLVSCCACGPAVVQNAAAVAQTVRGSVQYGVKALFFDVFGTLVDWRTGIAREAEAHLKPRGHALDWLGFSDALRDQDNPGMEKGRFGGLPSATA